MKDRLRNRGTDLHRSHHRTAGYHGSTEVYLGQRFPTSGMTAAVGAQVAKQLRLQGTYSNGRAIYYPRSWPGHSTGASAAVVYQPSEQWSETLTLTYSNFDAAAGGGRLYDYLIARSRTSFQLNRYLFFRAIVEYNSYRRQIVTDLLASFADVAAKRDYRKPEFSDEPGVLIEGGRHPVAPSDMMDGRVRTIRQELDKRGFTDTPIMSYATKFASAFYGPLREATEGAPQFGDRRSYQMDPATRDQGLLEAATDINEGADMLMASLPWLIWMSFVLLEMPFPSFHSRPIM